MKMAFPPSEEDNIYLDTLDPSKPPPRLPKNTRPFSPLASKGRITDSSMRPAPKNLPEENLSESDEDVYLIPSEDQTEEADWSQPVAAYPPIVHRAHKPPMPSAVPILPIKSSSLVKPPLPRMKSTDVSSSPPDHEQGRRSSWPVKPAPPPPQVKPVKLVLPSPVSPKHPIGKGAFQQQSEVKASTAQQVTREDLCHQLKNFFQTPNTQEFGLQGREWFAGNCDRKTAEAALTRVNKDGAFLLRNSSGQETKQPYTLAVLFQKKVYNIPVRYMEYSQQYALGKEGKKSEEYFSKVTDIIDYHSRNPIMLIDSKTNAKNSVCLTHPTTV
ncbi:SH2 domain-containing protein 6 isoform X2 [Polypterus senegalus]|nr:SH2 domain-containing protein 6 isoform X2 [Polypterus senegalus]